LDGGARIQILEQLYTGCVCEWNNRKLSSSVVDDIWERVNKN